MRKVYPIPEIIIPGEWDVRESTDKSGAYVDLESKTIVVPMGDNPGDEFIRAHESMHLAITPRDGKSRVPAAVKERTVQAIEDCRVNSALRTCGIDTSAPGEGVFAWPMESYLSSLAKRPTSDPTANLEMARSLLGCKGRAEEAELRAFASKLFPEALAAADRVYSTYFESFEKAGDIAPFQNSLDAASELTAWSEEVETKEDPGEPGEGDSGSEKGESGGSSGASGASSGMKGDSGGSELSDGPQPDSEEEESETPSDSDSGDEESEEESGGEISNSRLSESFSPDGSKPQKLNPTDYTAEEREDAREILGNRFTSSFTCDGLGYTGAPIPDIGFTVKVLPLTERHNPKKGFSKKASDTGAIPRNFHRLPSDGRVFNHKSRNSESAAVVIDGSGSMHLDLMEVQRVIDEYPASIIALYSGEESHGTLWILADYGKRIKSTNIEELNYRSGGNTVDMQALQWLARRKEAKKIWVCDGIVTGKDDRVLGPKAVRKMVRLVRTNRIKRYHSMKAFIESFPR